MYHSDPAMRDHLNFVWPWRLLAVVGAVLMAVSGMTAAPAVGSSSASEVDGLSSPVGQQILDGPDNTVFDAVVGADGTRYLGGSFARWGPQTGRGGAVNLTSGEVDRTFPYVSGSVYAVASDGAGGYYIGGNFTSVGGVPRQRLAHILATGQVDPSWNPGANALVRTLAVQGSVIYIGGDFTTINNTGRNRLAAVSVSNQLMSWNPNADDTVRSLLISGSDVYVAGSFDTINGQARLGLARVGTNGTLDATWDPNNGGNAADAMWTLADAGSSVLVGGEFTKIGSNNRTNVAAINTDGTVQAWSPNPDGAVRAIHVDGSTAYFGGDFTTFASTERNRAVSMDLGTQLLTSWNPNVNDTVWHIDVAGSVIYVAGAFTDVGGTARNRMAATDANGSATSWNPDVNNTVLSFVVEGQNAYLGGDFTSIGGVVRNGLVAVNPDGTLADWNPNVTGTVYTMQMESTTIFFGGEFSAVGGQSRTNLASIGTNGTLGSWNPNADGQVRDIDIHDGTAYVGGFFVNVGGTPRSRLAAISTSGAGTVDPSWTPSANNIVYAVDTDGVNVYVGGIFTEVNAATRSRLASISIGGSLSETWTPSASDNVFAVRVSGSTVYVGGDFVTVNGEGRTNLAAIGTDGTLDPTWNPGLNGTVEDIAVADSNVYVGGNFTQVGATTRNRLAAISADGTLRDWNPNANNRVYTLTPVAPPINEVVPLGGSVQPLAVEGAGLITGGDFVTIDGQYSASGVLSAGKYAELISAGNVPGAPQTVAINTASTSVGGRVEVSFTAPTQIGSGAIDHYQFEVATASTNYTNWTAATAQDSGGVSPCAASPCTVTGLTDGTRYRVRVQAVNATGAGAYSPASNWFIPVNSAHQPSPPSELGGVGLDSAIRATWVASSSAGEGASTVNRYRIFAFDGSTMVRICQTTGTPAPTTCDLTDLTNGTGYGLRGRSFNNLNVWSDLTDETVAITPS